MMAFGFGGFGMLFMLLFWILVAGLVVWALAQFLPGVADRTSTNGAITSGFRQDSALDVLRQRYARGELSKAEYDDMRRELAA
jgi:putative membrane protein